MFFLLRRFFGCEVYLGDVFYLYLWFLERVVKLNFSLGEGSMIVLLIVEI